MVQQLTGAWNTGWESTQLQNYNLKIKVSANKRFSTWRIHNNKIFVSFGWWLGFSVGTSRKLMATSLKVCYQQDKQRCFIVFHFSTSSWYRKKSDSVFISSLSVICCFTSTVGFVSLHILIMSEDAEFMSCSLCNSFPLFPSTPSLLFFHLAGE